MNIRRVPHIDVIKDPVDYDPNEYYGFAIVSLVVGIIGICLAFVPFLSLIGIALWIFGIILGIKGLRSRGKVMAMVGIFFSSIGVITAVVNLVLALRYPTVGF